MSGDNKTNPNGVKATFDRLEGNLQGIIARQRQEHSARVLREIIGDPIPLATITVNGHTVQEYVGPGGKMTGVPRVGMGRPNLDEVAYFKLADEARRLPPPVHQAIMQIYTERMTQDERILWASDPFDKLTPKEHEQWAAGFKAYGVSMTADLFAVAVDLNMGSPSLKAKYYNVGNRPVSEALLAHALPAPKKDAPTV